jgi:hypothetical protein
MDGYEATRRPWLDWSAVWVGALSALAVGLVIGLIGFAVGAHEIASPRVTKWSTVRTTTLAFNIAGAFFSFVVGGWVAARFAGVRRCEPAMLHGAIAWLVTVPLILVLAALGAAAHYGGWYGGLAGAPGWAATPPPVSPEVATAMRNSAFGAVVGLLLGLVGSVVGGWMASGEPMTLTYYRRREVARPERARTAA